MIPPKGKPVLAPIPITLNKVLLTEGETPTHFCEALLCHLDLSDKVEIRNFGGVTNLGAALSALTASAEFQTLVESVGIIRDAETDAATARRAVDAAIATANMPTRIRSSIFILPDNASPGMIETLCMQAVQDHVPFVQSNACLNSFFNCLDGAGITFPDPLRRVKNYAQAYLATKREAQMFPGIAAYRGYWPWESPSFEPLKQFLRLL